MRTPDQPPPRHLFEVIQAHGKPGAVVRQFVEMLAGAPFTIAHEAPRRCIEIYYHAWRKRIFLSLILLLAKAWDSLGIAIRNWLFAWFALVLAAHPIGGVVREFDGVG